MNISFKIQWITSLIVFSAFIGPKASAQTSVGGGTSGAHEDCRIRYSYDAAGNRVRREYRCITWDPYGTAPVSNAPLFNVHPNPTSGPITVTFSEVVSSASFMITAADGSLVQTYELMQPSSTVTFDITPQAPGTYFLTIWAQGNEETHSIIKSQ